VGFFIVISYNMNESPIQINANLRLKIVLTGLKEQAKTALTEAKEQK